MQEREVLEVDVLYVGGGIAALSSAYHLTQLAAKKGLSLTIAVIDKARDYGNHTISGAVMDPRGIEELMPDYAQRGMPVEAHASEEKLAFFTERMSIPSPIIPPFMKNKGYPIVSLSKVNAWLLKILEKTDINLFFGQSGAELLYEGDSVIGVRCTDAGLDKQGKPGSRYTPGPDIRAKVTVLAEGARGSLTKTLVQKFALDADSNKQGFTLGVKEIWEIEPARFRQGVVMHTMGYPVSFDTLGGAFVYSGAANTMALGMVVSLDSPDPALDAHEKLQRFKKHPAMAALLTNGKPVAYGARLIPEGGWFALPRLSVGGALIIGDAAGFVNAMRIKGIHLAIKSGMLAAETIVEACGKGDFSKAMLASFETRVNNSWIKDELWGARNFHQAFRRGLVVGGMLAGIQLLTRGWCFGNRLPADADHTYMEKWEHYYRGRMPESLKFDALVKSKEDCVYLSGTKHEEGQPCHLVVEKPELCGTQCRLEYGNPCTRFCPARVYEMEEVNGQHKLKINPGNCLHCKACDVRDPYGVITWKCPEGGGGPHYTAM